MQVPSKHHDVPAVFTNNPYSKGLQCLGCSSSLLWRR